MELKWLKIGRKKYRIKYGRLPDEHGRISFSTSNLSLDDPQPPLLRADTLLHEIFHGLWNLMGLSERVREEKAVTALAQGLVTVFRDNPGLLGHIEKLIAEGR